MSTINKVPASAGAEWLLGGFALLKRAPVPLGSLTVLWGLASLLLMLVAVVVPATLYALQFLLILGGPLFFAGMIWAVREVDQNRPALPAHLLQPVRDGHVRALLATLLPQAVAALVMGALLFVLVGTDELKHLGEVWKEMQAIAAAGGQPDPAMMDGLPAGRLLLWLLLVAIVFVAVKWMTFVASPQILFSGTDAWTAMRNSLRACAENWPAMLVFYLLAGIAIFAITMGLFLLASLLQLLVGPMIALVLWQFLLMAVLVPVLAGAVYCAWRQMMGGGDRAPDPQAPAHIEA
ncbi:BPSS1780 family membrane protein [Pseudoxanthomonas putridarboris]|uniref:BPSS1780 family membrane protein n=1 Tax=Pseudoxanthomonas putridarboris TaxID=752605 RepID=A0ABU9J3N5_9GAMM